MGVVLGFTLGLLIAFMKVVLGEAANDRFERV